jgi:hypothetical protein
MLLLRLTVLSGALHRNTLEGPRGARNLTGQSKTRRLRGAFAAHLRHVGQVYPAGGHREVVLLFDNAPWQAGVLVRQALADNPHLRLKRLPSHSPQLSPIERFWK